MAGIRAFILGLLGCIILPAAASAMPVAGRMAVHAEPGIDRVVLEVSEPVGYESFALENPARIVIDLPRMEWRAGSGLPEDYRGAALRNIRVAQFNADTTRMVLDLAQPARLGAVDAQLGSGGRFRLVFPIITASTPIPSAPASASASTAGAAKPVAKPAGDWAELAEKAARPAPLPPGLPFTTIPVPVDKPQEARRPVVVIDAGHGGRDPGATGRSGTQEKNVTLQYARDLAKALADTGRYEVRLTREDDTYIMLRERLAIGRRAKGDIFISIHADSAENNNTRGLSVYTLSDTASDKEAAALAARENKVDLIYGLNLSSENPDVTEILIDLAQRETKNKSTRLADILVEHVGKKVQLLPNTHRYAGFAVLKAPDVPSVLIELGFLSNRKDEALITSANYRREVVAALVQGIDAYFKAQRER